jgi:hypothetical protein
MAGRTLIRLDVWKQVSYYDVDERLSSTTRGPVAVAAAV